LECSSLYVEIMEVELVLCMGLVNTEPIIKLNISPKPETKVAQHNQTEKA